MREYLSITSPAPANLAASGRPEPVPLSRHSAAAPGRQNRTSRRAPTPGVEHARRVAVERFLQEEISQQLTGIALLVAAIRRSRRIQLAPDDADLADIADLLESAIGQCRTVSAA